MKQDTVISLDVFLRQAMEAAFRGLRPYNYPISLAAVCEQVRRNYPNCTVSDADLNMLVGDHAILHGYNVHFDGKKAAENVRSSSSAS